MTFSVSTLKATVGAVARQGVRWGNKNLPNIMFVAGTLAVGAAVYEMYGCALEADRAIKQAEEEKGEALTKTEKGVIVAKKCWKAFLIGLIAVGFFCGAHRINLKRQAALSAAYAMTLKDYNEFKAKAVEQLGEKKIEKIQDEVAAERVALFDPAKLDAVAGIGPLWCDAWSNTLFRGDLETIRKIVNDLNDDIYQCHGKAYFNGEITLNDVYYALSEALHAPQLGPVSWGANVGFRADLTGPIDITDIRYSKAPNGEPCGYINFKPLLLTDNVRDLNY